MPGKLQGGESLLSARIERKHLRLSDNADKRLTTEKLLRNYNSVFRPDPEPTAGIIVN